jgi:hypothetical protein
MELILKLTSYTRQKYKKEYPVISKLVLVLQAVSGVLFASCFFLHKYSETKYFFGDHAQVFSWIFIMANVTQLILLSNTCYKLWVSNTGDKIIVIYSYLTSVIAPLMFVKYLFFIRETCLHCIPLDIGIHYYSIYLGKGYSGVATEVIRGEWLVQNTTGLKIEQLLNKDFFFGLW